MSHPIPSAALDDRLGFIGTAGSGKTYNAGSGVERLLTSGARVVIPDPLGVWWGLALASDGKSPSVFREKEKLVIFGGPRGDLPLTEHAGALIGETVAGMAESCILDLSELGTKAAERRFMLAFLTALYRYKTSEPLHVVFDEADMWAPQRVLDKEGEANKLLGMMETVVRRGRVRGFIPWLITQRPAVLSKDVLSQIDGLVAFKLTSSQDRDAIGDWVQGQADKKQWQEIWAQLPTMERGQGVIWLPARNVLKIASFPEKLTFDSSRAPKRGERLASAKALQPVNIDRLKARLAKVEAETKANDPKALRTELAQVRAELQKAQKNIPQNIPTAEIKAIEKAAYTRGEAETAPIWFRRGVEAAVEQMRDSVKTLGGNDFISKQLDLWKHLGAIPKVPSVPRAATSAARQMPSPVKAAASIAVSDGTFNRPQIRVLRSLAMWKSLGHDAPSREMVAAGAGYAPGSGGFNNLIGGLGTMGALSIPAAGRITLTTDQIDTPTIDEGRDALLSILSNPHKKLVAALNGTGAMTREQLAEASGYAAGSGGFNNLIGKLNTLGISYVPSQGQICLSDWAQELLNGYEVRAAA